MPSPMRRREIDIRSGRFESEVRQSDMQTKDFINRPKFMCSKCKHMYEEKSRNCPRCDTRSMGEIRQIPEKYLDEAHRNALRRAQQAVRGGQ